MLPNASSCPNHYNETCEYYPDFFATSANRSWAENLEQSKSWVEYSQITLVIVGLITNALIVLIFLNFKNLCSESRMNLISLSFADGLYLIMHSAWVIVPLIAVRKQHEDKNLEFLRAYASLYGIIYWFYHASRILRGWLNEIFLTVIFRLVHLS